MKRLLFLLVFLCGSAQAFSFGDFDRIGLHTASYHDPEGGANNFNLGIYLHTEDGFVIGTYYNSWCKQSLYAGWSTPEWHRLSMSVIGVTGYWQPVTFIAIPSVRLFTNDYGASVHLSGSPAKITEDGQMVLHLSFSWPIK